MSVEFIHPTTGLPPSATSGYTFYSYSVAIGGQHCAWDVGVDGHGIKNIKAGVVSWEDWHWQLGWHVYITSDDGMRILYAHMRARALVRVGQRVAQGVLIGYVGATGATFGAHLHFAMSYKDTATAAAKVHEYGGSAAAVKWRSDHQLAYVDPGVFINKEKKDMPLDAADLAKITEIVKAHTMEGLIQQEGSGAVYFMSLGMKRGIPNPAILNASGADWGEIKKLSAADFARVPVFDDVIKGIVKNTISASGGNIRAWAKEGCDQALAAQPAVNVTLTAQQVAGLVVALKPVIEQAVEDVLEKTSLQVRD